MTISVLDVLYILSIDSEATIFTDSIHFEYTKIGKSTVSKDLDLKFVPDEEEKYKGSPISGLVFTEDKANVSIRCRKNGTVALTNIPEALKGQAPEKMKTFIWRAYSIIHDGTLNVKTLPVSMHYDTFQKLSKEGINLGDYIPNGDSGYFVINLESLPVYIPDETISIQDLCEREVHLLILKAKMKAYKEYHTIHFPKRSVAFDRVLGEDVTNWLKSIGITDYNGFNPARDVSGEEKGCSTMEVKIKGFSSIPAINAILSSKDSLLKPCVTFIYEQIQEEVRNKTLEESYFTSRELTVKNLMHQSKFELFKIKFDLLTVSKRMPGMLPDSQTITVKNSIKDVVCTVVKTMI